MIGILVGLRKLSLEHSMKDKSLGHCGIQVTAFNKMNKIEIKDYNEKVNNFLKEVGDRGLLDNITWQFKVKPTKNGMAEEYMLYLYYEDDLYEDEIKYYYAEEDWGCDPHYWLSVEQLVAGILSYCADWKNNLVEEYYEVYLADKENGEDLSVWDRYMDDFEGF